MNKYIGTRIITATPMTRGAYNEYRGWTLPADEYSSDKGFLVEYEDGGKGNDHRHVGYITWLQEDVFGREFRPMAGMTFGQAIEALKQGKKVARKGWNGKGMFLWLKPAAIIKSEWCKDPLLKKLTEDNGGEIQALGTICMFTHDSTGRKAVLTGWLASQSDMLLEDWEVVDIP